MRSVSGLPGRGPVSHAGAPLPPPPPVDVLSPALVAPGSLDVAAAGAADATRVLSVAPPPYTNLPAKTLDPRSEPVVIPAGSTVTATATSNAALESVALRPAGSDPIVMTAGGSAATTWASSAEPARRP